MHKIYLYNTATKQKEEFIPQKEGKVGIYCCGPTVYHYAHIGNLRTFIFEDMLVRTLRTFGYDVKHVMNITDVGHLTSDADEGEDKLEVGAKREGKTVWDIAQKYTDAFFAHAQKLNILKPTIVCKATDHIEQQIDMIKKLEEKGHTYQSGGNIFFDISTFSQYADFGRLQLQNEQKHRVQTHEGKRQPQDFALWFTKSKFEKHAMNWDSPWGNGYPGWHIECSAMAYHYLHDMMDIHCGGVDHIPVHHTNEIAQSECATGKQFFQYWIHCEFLLDETGKMSKSKGDFLTIDVLEEKGFDPLAYRYLCLTAHHRKQLTFQYEALEHAQTSLRKLQEKTFQLSQNVSDVPTAESEYVSLIYEALGDDLNIPKTLGILYQVLDSDITDAQKLAHISLCDSIFGLGLLKWKPENIELPEDIQFIADQRQNAREKKDWAKSDELRALLDEKGYSVKDTKDGQTITKKT
ncbi:MAG: cysteine--tRNA ligase [Candidatus Woesearchaeota archaeon]